MRVIFLDIDGVLNSSVFVEHFHWISAEHGDKVSERLYDKHGIIFDPMCVRMLNWIIESTDAKIVMSSSWRLAGLESMKEMWNDRKLPGEIIDVTPYLSTQKRGDEIKQWLEEANKHHNNISNYVILDDDTDFHTEQIPHFVNCDGIYGLTVNNAKKAVEILCKHED